MRLRHFCALVVLAMFGAVPALAMQSQQPMLTQANQPFHRGVNLLGYDPYWGNSGKRRFEWRHFDQIHKAGFDFVRLVLQAFSHMDSNNRLDPVWLAKLDEAVGQAQKAGLGVIIDEHDFNPCSEDLDVCRTKLTAFWQQVAPRFTNAPHNVAFEILNEPHDKLNGSPGTGCSRRSSPSSGNPTRPEIVVVGPTHWNSLNDLPLLKLPSDPNLLVTFHYYEPFHFTHQGATWVGPEIQKLHGITWGSDQDRAAVRSDFDKVATWAAANHRPILLGEFGAYDKSGTPIELRAAYTQGVRSEAERHGFAWAYWQFEGDFVVWDMPNQRWVEPILKALIP